MNGVNVPLLRKVVEWAEAESKKPEIDREWKQDLWITTPAAKAFSLFRDVCGVTVKATQVKQVAEHCGTAYCIAGYIAQSVDARYVSESEVDGVDVSRVAARELGIEEDLACARGGLFYGSNTIHDIRRIAEELAGEKL